MFEACGVRPDFVIGHSVGELAAAHVSGVLSLGDACTLVAARGRLMQALSAKGAMMALEANEDEARALLEGHEEHVSIAALNAPNSLVISGEERVVLALAEDWSRRNRKVTRLRVSHAFHSPHMDSMLAAFSGVAGELTYHAPTIPIISNLTGAIVGPEVSSPSYWVSHVRKPVRFLEGMRVLAAQKVGTYLELGSGGVLCGLGRACIPDATSRFTSALRDGHSEEQSVLAAISQAYLGGASVDLNAVFSEHATRPVDLPTYPFARERFWLDPGPSSDGGVIAAGIDFAQHPLLVGAVDLPDTGSVCFTGRIDLQRQPWLADHVIGGASIAPGTAFIEWALFAGSHVGCERVAELTLEAPLALQSDRVIQLRVMVDAPDEQRSRSVRIYSRVDDSQAPTAWTRNASGVLDSAPWNVPAFEETWPPREAHRVDVADAYDSLAHAGYAYGSTFRALRALWVRGSDIFADIAVDEQSLPDAKSYAIHPALFDAALQAAIIPRLSELANGTILVPFSFRATRALRRSETALRVHVRQTDGQNVALALYDSRGQVLLTIDKLNLRTAPAAQYQALAPSERGSLFVLDWQLVSPAQHARGAHAVGLVGEDRLGLREALHAQGVAVPVYANLTALDESLAARAELPEFVIATCSLYDGEDATGARSATQRALMLVQAWIDDDRLIPSQLVLLTSGAVAAASDNDVSDLAGAAVWGLVRTAQSEHPGRFALIDVDEDPASLAILPESLKRGELQIAIRNGRIVRPRVTHHSPHPLSQRVPWNPDGTVLITGGTGALGALLARHLVRSHAVRHLVLMSRRGRSAPGAAILAAELTGLGAQVTLAAADASDRHDVEEILRCIPSQYPLTAVVHAAGVLDDATIVTLTPQQLDRVLRAKMDGALNLHALTLERHLAAFVLFSSVMGTIGGAGQANYAAANAYLDALAHRRRALGLHSLSLAWGWWDHERGLGGALSPTDRSRMSRTGLAPMSVEAALALFDRALTSEEPVLLPVRLDGSADGAIVSPILGAVIHSPQLRREADATPARGLRERLAGLTNAVRDALLLDFVRDQVAAVLGHATADGITSDGDLWELGFDSLTAIELSSRLTTVADRHLSTTLVFDHPTARALALHLRSVILEQCL